MPEPVLVSVDRGVAVVTLHRPDRGNAWNPELEGAYFAAMARLAEDAEVRAVVLTGAGRSFCVGADVELLEEIGDGGEVPPSPVPQTMLRFHPKPIVAAVNGACAGVGLVQAVMCDVRIAAEGAKFTTAFARRGLVAEHGISWVLPRLVGSGHAADLLLSGRVVLAEEALHMGLVNRVVPPADVVDSAVAYARELAETCSPASMAIMKAQLQRALEVDLPTALAEADELMHESLRSRDFREGVRSFVDKRAPRFAGLSAPMG